MHKLQVYYNILFSQLQQENYIFFENEYKNPALTTAERDLGLSQRIFLLHFLVFAEEVFICAAKLAQILVKVKIAVLHFDYAACDV